MKEEETEESSPKVPIPEEFQIKVMELLDECSSKEELSFIRDAVYRKEDEHRKEEMKKEPKPVKYSSSDMPATD